MKIGDNGDQQAVELERWRPGIERVVAPDKSLRRQGCGTSNST